MYRVTIYTKTGQQKTSYFDTWSAALANSVPEYAAGAKIEKIK